MKATFNRTFLKELGVIPPKTRAKVEQLVFKDILIYTSYTEIPSVKKLKGMFIIIESEWAIIE